MTIETTLVSTEHGFEDYDVTGHSSITRACVPHKVKVGDTFNIYHHESSKSAIIWQGDLLASILSADI